MRVLVATHGDRADDFAGTVAGELVYLGIVCDRDRLGIGACGCGRAFAGVTSGASTTVAEVRDLDLTAAQYAAAIHHAHERAGWAHTRRQTRRMAVELLVLASRWPPGTAVRRNVDRVDAEDGQQV